MLKLQVNILLRIDRTDTLLGYSFILNFLQLQVDCLDVGPAILKSGKGASALLADVVPDSVMHLLDMLLHQVGVPTLVGAPVTLVQHCEELKCTKQ